MQKKWLAKTSHKKASIFQNLNKIFQQSLNINIDLYTSNLHTKQKRQRFWKVNDKSLSLFVAGFCRKDSKFL